MSADRCQLVAVDLVGEAADPKVLSETFSPRTTFIVVAGEKCPCAGQSFTRRVTNPADVTTGKNGRVVAAKWDDRSKECVAKGTCLLNSLFWTGVEISGFYSDAEAEERWQLSDPVTLVTLVPSTDDEICRNARSRFAADLSTSG